MHVSIMEHTHILSFNKQSFVNVFYGHLISILGAQKEVSNNNAVDIYTITIRLYLPLSWLSL